MTKTTILWCGILVGGLVALRLLVAAFSPNALEYVQSGVFILLVAALVRFNSPLFPRSAAMVALLAGLLGAGWGYSMMRSTAGHGGALVYVTRLWGDESGGVSRIVREAVEATPEVTARPIYREFQASSSASAALKELFDQAPGSAGIVWGSTQFVRYSASPKAPVKLEIITKNHPKLLSGRLKQLKIVADVPVIGMSFEPSAATGDFIAILAQTAAMSGEERELRWKFAGRMNERWRAREHLAYPFFLIGTDLLKQFLSEGGGELGLLRCAIRDFQSALSFLKTGGNPELIAAVRNNLALTSAVLAEAEGQGFSELKENLDLAVRLVGRKDPFGVGGKAATIARYNREILFGKKKAGAKPRKKKLTQSKDVTGGK